MPTIPGNINDYCQQTKDWDVSYRGYQSKFPVMDLDDRLCRVEKMTLTSEQLDKYPSLREAYEQFLIVRDLTIGNENESNK